LRQAKLHNFAKPSIDGKLKNTYAMPAQALYLKYRPRTFDQVEGQAHITRTLKRAIAQNRVAHAYLFTGPRGTGKTTTARLLAKGVNCLAETGDKPDNTCANCIAINEERLLDLIEIDAASNTSVDDVRDLRDKVDFRPGEAKFKVYIIDEVHMLSNAAFNALLKTLEEPPPHVIFVLATTDPQKIPATVLSRVQRFDFRRLTLPEIVERLKEIASMENLQIESAAIDLIARQATGSMRDAISMLDQLTSFSDDVIKLTQVQDLLGAVPSQLVGGLVSHLASQDVSAGLTAIAAAVDAGADPRQLAREIVEYLRGVLLLKSNSGNSLSLTAEMRNEMTELAIRFSTPELLRSMRLFNQAVFELRASVNPTLPLEIAFIESALDQTTPPPTAQRPAPPSRSKPSAEGAAKADKRAPSSGKRTQSTSPTENSESAQPDVHDLGLTIDSLCENWNRVLACVRQRNKMAEAWLRDARPEKIEGKQIVLGFPHEVHAAHFEKQANEKELIERALVEIFKQPYRVKCVLSPQKARRKAVESDPLIRAAVSQWGAEITDIRN
jgi:DNA polymerase III subunit gamma/tau